MKVIFLVSLLQKSNKYKSNAIWVLPTFCFHFIVFCFLYIFFFFPQSPKCKASFTECKAGCTFPRIHSVVVLLWLLWAGHLCPQWAEAGLPKTMWEHTWPFDPLAESCILTNAKLWQLFRSVSIKQVNKRFFLSGGIADIKLPSPNSQSSLYLLLKSKPVGCWLDYIIQKKKNDIVYGISRQHSLLL